MGSIVGFPWLVESCANRRDHRVRLPFRTLAHIMVPHFDGNAHVGENTRGLVLLQCHGLALTGIPDGRACSTGGNPSRPVVAGWLYVQNSQGSRREQRGGPRPLYNKPKQIRLAITDASSARKTRLAQASNSSSAVGSSSSSPCR